MRAKIFWLLMGLAGSALAETPQPTWRVLGSEEGRRLEVDTASIQHAPEGIVTVNSRLVMAREVVDSRTGGTYKTILMTSRYDCRKRTTATLERSFVRQDGKLLRTDAQVDTPMLPVRSHTLSDRVLRELCRPTPVVQKPSLDEQLARIREVAATQLDDGKAAKPGMPTVRLSPPEKSAKANPSKSSSEWGGRGNARVKASAADAAPVRPKPLPGKPAWPTLCQEGRWQAPIDIHDVIGVNLEPIQFHYQRAPFSIVDTGETIEADAEGNSLSLLGKAYVLERIRFSRPGMGRVNGVGTPMSVELEHVAADGEPLIVSVPLEIGAANPAIQTLWDYLPLEKKRVVESPLAQVDLNQILPDWRGYHIFMGSLPRPPCTEGVLWVVLQKPVTVSAAQEAIFARFYADNARPPQPTHERRIKSSLPPSAVGVEGGQAGQGPVPAERSQAH